MRQRKNNIPSFSLTLTEEPVSPFGHSGMSKEKKFMEQNDPASMS